MIRNQKIKQNKMISLCILAIKTSKLSMSTKNYKIKLGPKDIQL